jgi:hypothetical protein
LGIIFLLDFLFEFFFFFFLKDLIQFTKYFVRGLFKMEEKRRGNAFINNFLFLNKRKFGNYFFFFFKNF